MLTVNAGFELFLKRLTPSSVETAAAKGHRGSVERCLRANLNVGRFFRSGSFGNGTSVRGFSDVDFFAAITPRQPLRSSRALLVQTRIPLSRRFPGTNVRIDSPAVVAPFGADGGMSHEVVPALFEGNFSGVGDVFAIADGSGGWMYSAPDAYTRFVRDQDRVSGSTLRPLIRLVKAWKFLNDVPMSSFYIELFIALQRAEWTGRNHGQNVMLVLNRMMSHGLPVLHDPIGVPGSVNAASTDLLLRRCVRRSRSAYETAAKAVEAEIHGKDSHAYLQWRKLFNQTFPARGLTR